MDESKELMKFVSNPKYREKVIAKVHREKDKEYNKRVKVAENEKNKLVKERLNEIDRINNLRWEDVGNKRLFVNRTEGKIKFNNTEILFSDIKGAELNIIYGTRMVTTSNEKVKSKKHASLGGAVAGGLIAGPAGVVIGGVGLAKTKGKTTGSSVTNQIPTCLHLGVQVNVNGFVSEIVLLSHQVDQSSLAFMKAQTVAQNIVSQLSVLSNTPVPDSYIRVEDELSVKAFNTKISDAEEELQNTINNKPNYMLPEMYRTKEQMEMSDAQYLEYLSQNDKEKEQELTRIRDEEKQRRSEEWATRKEELKEKVASVDYVGGAQKAGSIILNIILWCISIFVLIFAIFEFSEMGIISGVLLLLTAFIFNPIGKKVMKEKVKVIPYWVCIILAIVCFFAAAIVSPSSNNVESGTNQEASSIKGE